IADVEAAVALLPVAAPRHSMETSAAKRLQGLGACVCLYCVEARREDIRYATAETAAVVIFRPRRTTRAAPAVSSPNEKGQRDRGTHGGSSSRAADCSRCRV